MRARRPDYTVRHTRRLVEAADLQDRTKDFSLRYNARTLGVNLGYEVI